MTVSPGGQVIGDIRAPSASTDASMELHALEHLEIAEGAVIQGDLHYNVLQMHMGVSQGDHPLCA